jgi:hypothetical protein
MEKPKSTMAQQIAQAARVFELRYKNCAREWMTVFMNEETVVIALHGSLTAAENELVGHSAGAAQLLEYQQRLFADLTLLREIKTISGMVVRDTAVEIEPKSGSVVLLFTTNTVGVEFPLSPGRAARIHVRGRRPYLRPEGNTGRATTAIFSASAAGGTTTWS